MSSSIDGDMKFLLNFFEKLKNKRMFFSPILYILSLVWLFAHHLRIIIGKYEKMPIPVVCIGNITMGGAGKTPTVIFLANYLKKNNVNVHVVSRGYGGNFRKPTLVDPEIHNAKSVGDEPLLICRHASVWVSRNKKQGILAACEAGAEIVLLDDGHQNFSIVKDLNILVIDTEVCLWEEKIFPLGILRENPSSAIARADFFIFIGNSNSRKKMLTNQIFPDISKAIEGEFRPDLNKKVKTNKIVAFCGIGRPEKFFSMLRQFDLKLISQHTYPDHHFYTLKQLKNLLKIATENNALLVTTAKDYVKIPNVLKDQIYPVRIDLHLSKKTSLMLSLKTLFS
jgi:tetraacyldisaccharide 4'-kinase